MKKTILIFLAAVAIGWLALATGSNRLSGKIESMLRDDAVAVLGLNVEVGQVNIKLFGGQTEIRDLRIANPSGFPSKNVFNMKLIRVDLSVLSIIPAALGWRPWGLEEIVIEAPLVTVDVDEHGRSNLDVILQTVQQSQQGAARSEKTDETTQTKQSPADEQASRPLEKIRDREEPAHFKIDRLLIDNLSFTLNRANKDTESGSLEPIEMLNIGGDNGTTAAALGIKVSSRLASDILSRVLLLKASERLSERTGGLLNNLLKRPGNK